MNDYADAITRAAGQTCARIGGYASDLTGRAPVPGGVIVLADRTRQIGQVTFGHADLERGLPMTLHRRFEIGSISKVFTSLLAGQFAVESRLGLDDRVSGFLPWLDLGARARPATLRSLLNHTAGLVIGSDALPDDLAQIWRMRNLAVDPEAGRFHYSNLGFQILGLALGACAGEQVTDLVRSRLLEPMGMADSIAAVTNADRSGLAVGYTAARQDRPWVPGDPLAPATWFEVATADGNIAATGPDLARLVMLLLGRGEVAGRRVVAEAVVGAMVTSLAPDGEPITQLPGLPPVTSSRYGLGINVETIGGDQCLTHGGGMVGYSTFLLADVSAQVGVVVLTNADGDSLYAQMLARLAHADLLARLSGAAEPALPGADPLVRREDPGAPGGP
ncbi:MAG: serine hydrolase domain-containing protein, partial [Streptosporangiaceae bacterium]